MPIFQSERGRLHYEELGAGQPVLLIHGFTNYGLGGKPNTEIDATIVYLRGHNTQRGAAFHSCRRVSFPAEVTASVRRGSPARADAQGSLHHLHFHASAIAADKLGGKAGKTIVDLKGDPGSRRRRTGEGDRSGMAGASCRHVPRCWRCHLASSRPPWWGTERQNLRAIFYTV